MEQKNMNILLIHTDQQRTDTMGCYGNKIVKTPNIDKLAEQSTVFTNAHCAHPLCSPSRATWITGEYNHSHGLWRNGIQLSEERDNVVKSLANEGYETGIIGKGHYMPYEGDPDLFCESMHLSNPNFKVTEEKCWDFWKNHKFEQGFYGFKDVRLGLGHGDYGMTGGHYGLWLYENHRDLVPRFFREQGLSEDTSFDAWKSTVPLEVHSTTWMANQADDFFEKNRENKFFLSIGLQEPHPPFQPPEPYCHMYNPEDMPDPIGDINDFGEELPAHIRHYITRQNMPNMTLKRQKEILALYYGMMTLVDDTVGNILESLEKHGLRENTVVIYTSDHGDWMGDHGLNRKGAVHSKGLTQIPMIINWPSVSKQQVVEDVASQIDLAATIYDVANIRPHYTNQGKSLRNILDGEVSSHREYAYLEHCHECYRPGGTFEQNLFMHVDADKREQTVRTDIVNALDEDILMKTVVTNEYRFTYAPAIQYGELYDLVNDPEECHNLFGKDRDLQTKAEGVLLKAVIEATPKCGERTFGV